MNNSIKTAGRIIYIEPNEFASEQYGLNMNSGDNITWNPEDLSFSVDLQVIIPNRDVCGDAVDDSVLFNILSDNIDGNSVYKSFMGGDIHDPNNQKQTFLTDNFTNISYQELRTNKTTTKEALGIQSIDIKFDNFFFPKVTMKLVDVRGASLMIPTEEEYRKSMANKEKVYQNFFNALFHFPAPRFALSVKGYYGTRVTFMLSVLNFNGNFNSQNGNFEISIDFIGHMYGVYSDLPFNYIMVAPYIGTNDGNVNEYWRSQTTSPNGNFKYSNGEPIKTFVEFLRDYENMSEKYTLNSGKYDEIGNVEEINDELAVLTNLKRGYDSVFNGILNTSGVINTVCHDVYNNENFLTQKSFYIFVAYSNNINLNEDLLNDYRIAYGQYSSSRYFDPIITEEFTNLNYNIKYDECSNNVNDIPYSDIKEIYNSISKEYGENFKYKAYHFLAVKYSYILKRIDDLNDMKNKIISDFSTSDNFSSFTGDILNGFVPTIENVIRMTFAHIDAFMTSFYGMLETIKTKYKETRKLSYYEIKKEDTDILTNDENSFLPPFTGFYNKKERIYPSVYKSKLSELEELKFINDFFKGVNGVSTKLEEFVPEDILNDNISTFNNLYHGFHATLLTDYFYTFNPYEILIRYQNNLCDNLVYFIISRILINDALLFNGKHNDEQFSDRFFENECDNFLNVFPEAHLDLTLTTKLKYILDNFDSEVNRIITNVNSFLEGVKIDVKDGLLYLRSEKDYFTFDHYGNGDRKYDYFESDKCGIIRDISDDIDVDVLNQSTFIDNIVSVREKYDRICGFYFAPIDTEKQFLLNGPLYQKKDGTENDKTIYCLYDKKMSKSFYIDFFTQFEEPQGDKYYILNDFIRNFGDAKLDGKLHDITYREVAEDVYYENYGSQIIFPKKHWKGFWPPSSSYYIESYGIINKTFLNIIKGKANGDFNYRDYVIFNQKVNKAISLGNFDIRDSYLTFRFSNTYDKTLNQDFEISIINYSVSEIESVDINNKNDVIKAYQLIASLQYSTFVWGYKYPYENVFTNKKSFYAVKEEYKEGEITLDNDTLLKDVGQALNWLITGNFNREHTTYQLEEYFINLKEASDFSDVSMLFMPKSLVLYLGALTWLIKDYYNGDFEKAKGVYIDGLGCALSYFNAKGVAESFKKYAIDPLYENKLSHYWSGFMSILKDNIGDNSFYKYFMDWVEKDYVSLNNSIALYQKCSAERDMYFELPIANEICLPRTFYAGFLERYRETLYDNMLYHIMQLYSTFIPTYNNFFNKTVSDVGIKTDVYKRVIEKIYETLTEKYNNSQDNEDLNYNFEIEKVHVNEKNSCYYTLKSIYDKWIPTYSRKRFKLNDPLIDNRIILSGVTRPNEYVNEYSSFVFKDSMNRNIGNKFLISPQNLYDSINSHYSKGANSSVIEFITSIAFDNKLMFFALPVRTEMYNELSMKEIFTPHTIYDSDNRGATSRDYMNTYVLMYTYESSKSLNVDDYENSVGMTSDGVDIADINGSLLPENFPSDENDYNIPAFGVTFSKQNQTYFKNITLNMEGSRTTDYSIANLLMLSNTKNNGDLNTPLTMGQNMYPIFANRVYDCTVEMMGCMNIVPTMFFQLNNIPMFRGAYRIVNVTHHIENGSMTTKFVGTRVSKYLIPYNTDVIDIETLIERNMGNSSVPIIEGINFDYQNIGKADVSRKDITMEIYRISSQNVNVFVRSVNNKPFNVRRATNAFHTVLHFDPNTESSRLYGKNSTYVLNNNGKLEHIAGLTPYDRTTTKFERRAAQHRCASSVRQAIEDGYGVRNRNEYEVKLGIGDGFNCYKNLTKIAGYVPIFNIPSVGLKRSELNKWIRDNISMFKEGDVAIMRKNKKEDDNDYGHICMLESIKNGIPTWCSDYNQGEYIYCWKSADITPIETRIYIFRHLSFVNGNTGVFIEDENESGTTSEKTYTYTT